VAALFEEEERSSLESRGEESVKRRNFAVAAAFVASLLVAAIAAASVSAATSSHKATSANGKQFNAKPQAAKNVGVGQVKPTAPHQPKFINSPAPANATAISKHDRLIPGKLGPKGAKAPGAAAGAAPAAPFIPHAHSLPITSQKYTAKPGLNAYNQDS